MARRIKSKKRKHLGNRTWGTGNKKNNRGKGCKGGVGRGGYHKQKWFQTIKQGKHKPEKKGIKNKKSKKNLTITLDTINKQHRIWPKDQQRPDMLTVDLSKKKTKVLSNGSINFKAKIIAHAITPKAKQKIEQAGGTTTTPQANQN